MMDYSQKRLQKRFDMEWTWHVWLEYMYLFLLYFLYFIYPNTIYIYNLTASETFEYFLFAYLNNTDIKAWFPWIISCCCGWLLLCTSHSSSSDLNYRMTVKHLPRWLVWFFLRNLAVSLLRMCSFNAAARPCSIFPPLYFCCSFFVAMAAATKVTAVQMQDHGRCLQTETWLLQIFDSSEKVWAQSAGAKRLWGRVCCLFHYWNFDDGEEICFWENQKQEVTLVWLMSCF